jgi:UDP-N-acetylglucosamine--N-acetylmuramyl-(pentapeptide) pyrophosphoryl-undecaprenol N-acetylglucosamine transferase
MRNDSGSLSTKSVFPLSLKSQISNLKSLSVIFAGGGSGGHISPGLAIAERLKAIAPDSKAIFVCSNRAIDAAMLSDAGAEFVAIPASPPSLNPLAAWRFILNFQKSKRIVGDLIRTNEVSRVVTLGGFVAAPAVCAANSCGVPATLVNLDSVPGRANRWMAKRSDEVLSAVEIPSMPGFVSKGGVVGMPIRRRALAPADAPECRVRLRLDPHRPTLFVTGASQGATSINAMMIALAASNPRMFDDWQIYHLSGSGADEPVRAAFSEAGIKAVVEPFINEIGLAWGAADIAISRAGASSVAEAAHNAVPTIFLPYPFHKDMHQTHNAQPLVDLRGGGGAMIVTDLIDAAENARAIGPVLSDLMKDAARREAMRSWLRSHQFPDAAMTIARMLVPSGVA